MPATADRPIIGWMHDGETKWLREQARGRCRIAEIGVWQGMTTEVLLEASKGTVWAIDNWNPSDPKDEAVEQLKKWGKESAFNAFLERMRPWSRRLVIMRMDSKEAWRRLSHLSFDMIFIDADHRYEHAEEDIRLWKALLAPGGLLCGHDGQHPGVAKAVAELVPKAKFLATPQPPPLEHEPSLIWYWSDGLVE